MVVHSQDPVDFISRAKVRKGIATPVPCGRCGRLLTDPVSIARGYGEECAAQVHAERALVAAWPTGTRVRVTAGSHAGLTGTVRSVDPRKVWPVKVWLDGKWCAERFPADRLERIDGAA
jgi:hypothetical protein